MIVTLEVFEHIYTSRTLIYYGKNYGTMKKTLVLWKKPMVLSKKKMLYYTSYCKTLINHGTKKYGTMEKNNNTVVNYSKL